MNRDKAQHALNDVLYRIGQTLDETGDHFPYFFDIESDRWITTADGNWCSGHWIMLLWLAWKLSKTEQEKRRFEEAAMFHTSVATGVFDSYRQSIFAGLNFNMIGFQAAELTGKEELKQWGIKAADVIVNLYHPKARQIASGIYMIEGPQHELNKDIKGKGWGWVTSGMETSAVDSAHAAIPVLINAYKETNDSKYRDVMESHLNIYLNRFIRENGSTRQLVRFDPLTGEAAEEYKNLSVAKEGCWARGFGWCVSGLSEIYNFTKEKKYLDALRSLASYYRTHSNDDLIPCWDMSLDAKDGEPRDTSCAALVAYGLVSLKGEQELQDLGISILESLCDHYLVKEGSHRGMLMHGCFSRPKNYAYDNELIWSDYYLAYVLETYLNQN